MVQAQDLERLAEQLSGVAETTRLDEATAAPWTVRGARPRLLCAPASAEAATRALALCAEAGAQVIPWGGGSQQRLGAPPRGADVVLVTRALAALVEYEPANLTATVQAGMRLAELQRLLGERGQRLPYDPPVAETATIGGLLATNPSGPLRLRVGGLRDLVIGTRVATPRGTLAKAGGRVVKNVTGYDVNKLYIGALGTLGLLVEVTLKVAPRPATEATWLGIFDSADAATAVAGQVLRSVLQPSALELLNARAAALCGLAVPEGRWALLARASGFRPAVERHLREFSAAAQDAERQEELPAEQGDAVWSAYASWAAARRWAPGHLTCRLALPPATVGQAGDRVATLGVEPVVWAQATGAAFWSVADDTAQASALSAELRGLATTLGGAAIVENWPDGTPDLDPWGPSGVPLELMRALKEQYDPRGTLNLGRYVGGI
ncbi:MAG: FAD-binding oxidoreductase [Chloroflexota bacterium]